MAGSQNQKKFNVLSWILIIAALVGPFLAWLQGLDWDLGRLTAFQLFPLFGLWAWFIMWAHFVLGAIRIKTGLTRPRGFKRLTGYAVLASLLLHPGILIIKLWQNGAGLPPNSYINYVGDSLALAVFLGSLSWLVFISFELLERLKNRPLIARNWHWVGISQALGMTLIFVHGLRLGDDLAEGWLRAVWLIAGVALIPAFYAVIKNDLESKNA